MSETVATRTFYTILAASLAGAGCTVLLDRSPEQCSADKDCKGFSASAVCVNSLCTEGEQGSGPPGCFSGAPTQDVEFYNRCTTSRYLEFDNCARIGLCGGGYDPTKLVDPPVTTPTPPSNLPINLPTVGCYDSELRPKVIYMQGSTNFTSFIQTMAPLVAQKGYALVWQPTSSCLGAAAGGFGDTAGKTLMRNPTVAGESFAAFYDANGNATDCALGNSPRSPESGAEITDIGQSDVFAASCTPGWEPGSADYPQVGHYLGPVQAMVFVVPRASSQRAISAEAAHLVFGGGGNRMISPWTDPEFLWIRSATTGTNNIISRGIDVPPTKWWGVDKKTAPAMRDALLTVSAAAAERTLGTLSMDFAEESKDSLHILYFQAEGQLAGFLPDSAPSARDKQNVRDGHYPLWGPIHLYTPVTGGQPSATASAFILPFLTPNQDLMDATIAAGNVPICAMSVTRDVEMGPLKAFSPDFKCSCYYEKAVTGATGCTPCSVPADCSKEAPACNLGFCEAQ